ncbi:MAG: pilus assembly protein [Gemmatimonadetes bacterium]|nr:pilus assembly protein [Gemmatimonadota bacterium]
MNCEIRRFCRRFCRPAPQKETGQTLVEFALVIPILLALVIGIFEFGRAWNVYQVITNTAREGARLAVVPSSDESGVRATIDQGLTAAALDPGQSMVTITGLGGGTGTPTTVQLDYPYQFQFIGPIVAFLDGPDDAMNGAITLSTTVIMRNE